MVVVVFFFFTIIFFFFIVIIILIILITTTMSSSWSCSGGARAWSCAVQPACAARALQGALHTGGAHGSTQGEMHRNL